MSAAFGHQGERLSAYLDGELGAAQARGLQRHVEQCHGCAQELDDLRATRAALRNLPKVETPLSFMVEAVVLTPTGDAPGVTPLAPIVLASAAGMLLLVGAFLLGGGDIGTVRPPVDAMVVDHIRSVEGGPVVVPARLDATTADQ